MLLHSFVVIIKCNAVYLQGYRPSAQRASILFFVLNDMGRIDPMYQFSLDAYIELFLMSIDKSQRSSKLDERIANLNDYHTYAVYRSVVYQTATCNCEVIFLHYGKCSWLLCRNLPLCRSLLDFFRKTIEK